MKHWVRHVLAEAMRSDRSTQREIQTSVERIITLIEQAEIHTFRTNELEAIANGLAECDDLEELSRLLMRATTSAGFQNYALFVIHHGDAGAFKTRVCTSYCQQWQERYYANSYHNVDPVALQAARENNHFLYSDLDFRAPVIDRFWEDAERFEIGRNGVCFVMIRKDGTRIGLTLSARASAEHVKEKVMMNGFDLEFIAHLAADCFCFLSSGQSISDETLTEQELRYLYSLSNTPPIEGRSSALSVASADENTGDAICRKLGAASIYQALVLATAKGWFDLLPYGPGDVSTHLSDSTRTKEQGPGVEEILRLANSRT